MATAPDVNLWPSAEHALNYLTHADSIPHRTEGEATLLEFVPIEAKRILDLGSGGGRLLALTKAARSTTQFVGLDFSPTMLDALRKLFSADSNVTIVSHDFENGLPRMGSFDAVISSFAIHHVSHERKHTLYQEIFDLLSPGGVFCNLEHVSSPSPRLHADEDPSNKLLDLETQLEWLREIGFADVDCHWKWRELALLAGVKPSVRSRVLEKG